MNVLAMSRQMNDVQRLAPQCEDSGNGAPAFAYMDEDPLGSFVRYTDYAALQQQLAAAREELATLRTLNEAHGGTAQLLDGTGATVHLLWGCCSNVHDTLAEAVTATLQRDRQP